MTKSDRSVYTDGIRRTTCVSIRMYTGTVCAITRLSVMAAGIWLDASFIYAECYGLPHRIRYSSLVNQRRSRKKIQRGRNKMWEWLALADRLVMSRGGEWGGAIHLPI